jgi:hypothetical protein
MKTDLFDKLMEKMEENDLATGCDVVEYLKNIYSNTRGTSAKMNIQALVHILDKAVDIINEGNNNNAEDELYGLLS